MDQPSFTMSEALKPSAGFNIYWAGIAIVAIIILIWLFFYKKEKFDPTTLLVKQQRGVGGHNPRTEHALGIINENRLSKTGMGR